MLKVLKLVDDFVQSVLMLVDQKCALFHDVIHIKDNALTNGIKAMRILEKHNAEIEQENERLFNDLQDSFEDFKNILTVTTDLKSSMDAIHKQTLRLKRKHQKKVEEHEGFRND